MSTKIDLSELSLMDALDLSILIEEEARVRYTMFAKQLGRTGSGHDAGSFFEFMAENEVKHGTELVARRKKLFGETPMRLGLTDIFDVEAPEMGAPRQGMSVVQAFELGLAAEKKAYDFFDSALPGISDEDVKALFTELRDEEAEHLKMLEVELAKLPESAKIANEPDPEDAPYL